MNKSSISNQSHPGSSQFREQKAKYNINKVQCLNGIKTWTTLFEHKSYIHMHTDKHYKQV